MSSRLLSYLGSAFLEALAAAAATTPNQADDKLVEDLRQWMVDRGYAGGGKPPKDEGPLEDGGGGGPG